MTNVTGRCLCGNVSYKAKLKSGIGACHCGMCRRWAGGPLMSVHAEGAVDITGKENISRFRSSDWAERGFCKHCGSNLFYHLRPNPKMPEGEYIFAAGSLDDQNALVFDHEVYVDHKPAWYSFADDDNRKRMTEADIVAMFVGG